MTRHLHLHTILFYLLAFFLSIRASAQLVRLSDHSQRVLVITSYSPDGSSTASVVRDFADRCEAVGIRPDISMESLNCDRFSDVVRWRTRIRKILSKFRAENNHPDVLLLLGQEAMSTYLSINISELPEVPVICGMVSRNYVELPSDSQNLSTWEPESRDVSEVGNLYNIVGGYFYQYDLDVNMGLISRYFPHVRHVGVLTDNSYGGVCIKSYIADQSRKHPNHDFLYLDGRNQTILDVADSISHMPDSTALLIGTWRFDKNNRFYLNSSIAMLRSDNPDIPVFTLTDTGIRDWAIGGYTPEYHNVGSELADALRYYIETGKSKFNYVSSGYVFNYHALMRFDIDEDLLPHNSRIVERPESVWDSYKVYVIGILLTVIVLSALLVWTTHQMHKNKRLKAELEKSHRELREAKNRAENVSMMKSSFLADISHELRTPLNAVVGFAEVITNNDQLTADERRNIMEIVGKNSKLLTSLLTDILDISRIESGRVKYNINEWDVAEICRTSIASVRMAQDTHGLDLRFETDLWACPLMTDRERLQQVVVNLIGNAVKFTDQGHVTISLSRTDDNQVQIAVSDTGRGIPPDKAEDVFRRFVKLDEYSIGTGLGLSLCRMIVENFGGKIWVDTSYVDGARLVVRLPQLKIEIGEREVETSY